MIAPKEAQYITEGQIAIKWDNGTEGFYTAQQLRQNCKCAYCISETTGEKILDPNTIPEDLTIKDWQQVGNYAYNFTFSDGHNGGIYAFDYLQTLQ